MSNKVSAPMLSRLQIEDATGQFSEALRQFDEPRQVTPEASWGPPQALEIVTNQVLAVPIETSLIVPDQDMVPRPNFELFQAGAIEAGCLVTANKELEVRPSQSYLLTPGLRGFVTFKLGTDAGQAVMTKPAIVLAAQGVGGTPMVAALLSEKEPDGQQGPRRIYDDQHALLDTEFVKQGSTLSATHGDGDVPTVREIGTSLMVASSADPLTIHHDSHVVADGNFGQNFGMAGRQDFEVGNGTMRSVRPRILPANRVIFTTAAHYQLPPDQQLFDLQLTPAEMAIGMTLAAAGTQVTAGKMPKVSIEENMAGVLNV